MQSTGESKKFLGSNGLGGVGSDALNDAFFTCGDCQSVSIKLMSLINLAPPFLLFILSPSSPLLAESKNLVR